MGARSEQQRRAAESSEDHHVSGELEQETEAAPGVFLRWDPFRPELLRVVDGLEGPSGTRPADPGDPLWRRLAAIRTLDRLLHLPLSQALLDAEAAATKVDVAGEETTPAKLREALVDDALRQARDASPQLERFLRQLAVGDDRPGILLRPVERLVEAYGRLAEKCDDSDSALDAVIEAGKLLRTAGAAEGARHHRGRRARPIRQLHADGGGHFLDPPLLPARVLGFSPRADLPDVRVTTRDGETVVIVEAFDDSLRLDDIAGMTVRVIDAASRQVRSFHPLGGPVPPESSAPGGSGGLRLETTVDLPRGASLAELRFDVQDGGDARVASKAELLSARRAFLFLPAWRRLVADVRLNALDADPAARLRRIVDGTLAGDRPQGADAPLWRNGPPASELRRLAELSDQQIVAATGADDTDDILHTACGAGNLLAAELAAAHAGRTPL